MKKRPPILISSRFRSGSTLLWNMFRSIPGTKAFYEPCHDNLLTHIRCNTKPHNSHLGVQSYWDEYAPICDQLEKFHKSEFGLTNLLLEKNTNHPSLEKYIRFLIDSCDNHQPILQFNRIDFRLPWIKENFPIARIIHLYRDPRDQWISMVRDLPKDKWNDPNINTGYDLLVWSSTLTAFFPFLSTKYCSSSYERHYYIWVLSKLMGERVAHCSINYNLELQQNPEVGLEKLMKVAAVPKKYKSSMQAMIKKTETGSWQKYKPHKWFEEIEDQCIKNLESLGLMNDFGLKPLSSIVEKNISSWEKYQPFDHEVAMHNLLVAYSDIRAEALLNSSKMQTSLDISQDYVSSLKKNNRDKETALSKILHESSQQSIALKSERKALIEAQVAAEDYAKSLETGRQTDHQTLKSIQQTLAQQNEAFESERKALIEAQMVAEEYAKSLETGRQTDHQTLKSIQQTLAQQNEAFESERKALIEAQMVAEEYAKSLETVNEDYGVELETAQQRLTHQVTTYKQDLTAVISSLATAEQYAKSLEAERSALVAAKETLEENIRDLEVRCMDLMVQAEKLEKEMWWIKNIWRKCKSLGKWFIRKGREE